MTGRGRRPRVSVWLLPIALLLTIALGAVPGLSFAQDATPDATPTGPGSRTVECVAPGTPAAMGATPEASPAMASPAASPAAEFTPTPAGSDAVEGMTRTVRALAECVNAGDFETAAALMTDNFIQTHLGVAGADEVAGALEGATPMVIRLLLTPETYDDGTASVGVVYEGGFNTTGSVVAERWYFVVEGGVYKLDRIEPAELPPGIS